MLWAARGCAVSHRSAAALHGFARFPEGPAELSVTRTARLGRPYVVHRVALLPSRDVTTVDGLRVTTVERTLVDLCALDHVPALRAAVDEALRRRKTTLERLEAALDRSSRARGLASLRHLVAELRGGRNPTESELEARVYDLLEAGGLPRPIVQQRVVAGGRARRLDFRIPGTPVVIEADGFAWHSAAARYETDRHRDNALLERGLRVLHWTWAAVRDRPEQLLAQLMNVLGSTAAGR